MGGNMSAVMLLLCYLPMTKIIIKCYIIQYVQSHNCISIIFVVSYMNHVSQTNSFLLKIVHGRNVNT